MSMKFDENEENETTRNVKDSMSSNSKKSDSMNSKRGIPEAFTCESDKYAESMQASSMLKPSLIFDPEIDIDQ